MNEENQAKEKAPESPKQPEARSRIDRGMLLVEIPLFMPNGEFIAYGMLHKSQLMVDDFFRQLERQATQAEGPRIIRPEGMPIR